ncbi:phospholipid carrier-dependent glycosyltransferase [Amycolatopsis sp. NPDC004625]|uniref:phospholipid carrier-dependent glycosyltransferase n=1 Tax=Amycolatopsis sp. NPDC004625 TaxID=3154670 RepID=UPI0033B8B9B5
MISRPPPAAGTPAPPPRQARRRRWYALVVFALLAEMAIAMLTTAVEQSPTIDEPVYAGTAVVYLEQHSLRYNPEHPPLGKLIIATGLAFADVHLDPGFSGDQTQLGRHVLYESGRDPGRLLLLARLPVIVLTLLFGLVVFAFARDLTGPAGGLVALALYALSPDVIAHGSLATLDVPVAGFLVTSAWRARRRPALYVPLTGLALGAAVATKMSALAAIPVVLVLVVLSVRHALAGPQWTRWLRGLGAAVSVALLAIAVVWASYLVVDPQLRWTSPPGLPPLAGLRSLASWLPLPEPYLAGMRIQFGFEDQVWTTFLFGTQHAGSLWYYLPAALLVKTPLGALVLGAAGAVVLLAVPRLRPAAWYVLLPTAALLAAAMTGSRDLGVRYVVFAPMFLAIAAAAVAELRRRRVQVAVAAVVLVTAASSVRTFPYYLPYANEAFGGPAATHLRLHDSNVDWGQDLGRLGARLREAYPGERVWLVYKGSGVPSYYGIDAADPLAVPASEVHGLLAVSDSAVAKADGRLAALIATSTQVDEVGHAITLYRRR